MPARCCSSTASDSALTRGPLDRSATNARSTPRIQGARLIERLVADVSLRQRHLDDRHATAARERVAKERLLCPVDRGGRFRRGRDRRTPGGASGRRAIDGRLDPCDVLGRRAAAPADEADAVREKAARIRRHVLGRREIDRPAFDVARPAGVGLRREPHRRQRGHALERLEHVRGPDAAVDADHVGAARLQRRHELLGRRPIERVAVLLDRHLRHERKTADGSHGRDRGADLVEVAERLEEDQINAAFDQRGCLLAEVLLRLIEGGAPPRLDSKSERTDSTRDVRRLAGRGAGEPDASDVDLGELVLEPERSELDAVGTEGIGLEDGGARLHVVAMHRADPSRVREVERVETAVDEDALIVENRAHRPVADEDAFVERLEKRLQFAGGCAPAGGATSRSDLSQMKSSLL